MGRPLFSLENYVHRNLFSECIYPWDALKRLDVYLRSLKGLKPIDPVLFPQTYLVNAESIFIDEGTVIEPGAYIQGPCVIGKRCQIRHGAYLRGGVLMGDECVVGHATEVKHSILLNYVAAAHFNYVGDSILGNHVNLGAGVKCANVKINSGSVFVHWENRKVDTGLLKLGALIADGVRLGCNCVTNPGTILGRDSICYPALSIHGQVPEKGVVRSIHKQLQTSVFLKELP